MIKWKLGKGHLKNWEASYLNMYWGRIFFIKKTVWNLFPETTKLGDGVQIITSTPCSSGAELQKCLVFCTFIWNIAEMQSLICFVYYKWNIIEMLCKNKEAKEYAGIICFVYYKGTIFHMEFFYFFCAWTINQQNMLHWQQLDIHKMNGPRQYSKPKRSSDNTNRHTRYSPLWMKWLSSYSVFVSFVGTYSHLNEVTYKPKWQMQTKSK